MQAIYKYKLKITDWQTLLIPPHQTLSVQFQNRELMLWAMVECDAPDQLTTIHMYGTGEVMQERGRHIGTVQQDGYVWHIFEQVDVSI